MLGRRGERAPIQVRRGTSSSEGAKCVSPGQSLAVARRNSGNANPLTQLSLTGRNTIVAICAVVSRRYLALTGLRECLLFGLHPGLRPGLSHRGLSGLLRSMYRSDVLHCATSKVGSSLDEHCVTRPLPVGEELPYSPAEGDILQLVPRKRIVEVSVVVVGPQLVEDVEVGVDRLDREEAAQASAAAPAEHQVDPRDGSGA